MLKGSRFRVTVPHLDKTDEKVPNMMTLARMRMIHHVDCSSCPLLQTGGIDENALHKAHQVIVKPAPTPILRKTAWEEEVSQHAQRLREFIATRTDVPPEKLSRRKLERYAFEMDQKTPEQGSSLLKDLTLDDLDHLWEEEHKSDDDWTG